MYSWWLLLQTCYSPMPVYTGGAGAAIIAIAVLILIALAVIF
jgi:hypothetical protein